MQSAIIHIILLILLAAFVTSGSGGGDSHSPKRSSNGVPKYTSTASRRKGVGQKRTKEAPDKTPTRFDDSLTSANLTALRGQTALLTCVVRNVGNKTVSWLRHRHPIPQVLAHNNVSNVRDERITALHVDGSEEFVLRIRHTRLLDTSLYECQVGGAGDAPTIFRIIRLEVVEPQTEILGGPDVYVDRGSTLNVTCVVYAESKAPDYIFWSHQDKIILFEGSETSERSYLLQDRHGRFLSRLIVPRMEHGQAGQYTCQPASAPSATVTVHVLNGTVLAVADAEDIPSGSSVRQKEQQQKAKSSTTSSKQIKGNNDDNIMMMMSTASPSSSLCTRILLGLLVTTVNVILVQH